MSSRPRLRLSAADLGAIRIEAAGAHPQECCGLLIGTRDVGGVTVATVIAAANIAAEPARRFEVDPKTLIAAHKAAREAGREVIGHYHSHPGGGAGPSAHDRARAIAEGEVWLIVPVEGSGAGTPAAHLFTAGHFEAMEITDPS